jgi:hypothetical protein
VLEGELRSALLDVPELHRVVARGGCEDVLSSSVEQNVANFPVRKSEVIRDDAAHAGRTSYDRSTSLEEIHRQARRHPCAV